MKRLIDFYPDLITESTVVMQSQRAAITLVRKVFGSKVGMFQKDKTVDGQRQIWVDVTHPATELVAQQQFEKWQQTKIKQLRFNAKFVPEQAYF